MLGVLIFNYTIRFPFLYYEKDQETCEKNFILCPFSILFLLHTTPLIFMEVNSKKICTFAPLNIERKNVLKSTIWKSLFQLKKQFLKLKVA